MQSRTLRQLSLAAVVTATQLFFYSVALAHGDGESTETPLWQLSPEQIAAQVNVVRGGADLTPKSWPNGAKVAVSFSFDVDTEPVWMGFQKQMSPSYMSRGEYGARVGMPRVMKLLEKHKINATFFIPAMSMLLHPEIVQAIRKHPTYEIGFHSYVHENPLDLTPDQERSVYEKALAIFVDQVGKRPVGFRSAAWDLTPSTIKLVQEMGFLYESSMMADDRPYQLIAEGKDTGLVELPVEWILDDWPYFQVSWPSKHVAMRNADDVYSIWKEEFDGAYEEGTAYILTMHPQVIGHRYRIKMLDRLITYMKSKPGVWFATHEEIARYVKAQASE
ncbi:MAG: polysaccharide deacetylase [Proteobacteria bacterium]|nr:polysaccharide deacetylase [Pseudomonadota bacterium]